MHCYAPYTCTQLLNLAKINLNVLTEEIWKDPKSKWIDVLHNVIVMTRNLACNQLCKLCTHNDDCILMQDRKYANTLPGIMQG